MKQNKINSIFKIITLFIFGSVLTKSNHLNADILSAQYPNLEVIYQNHVLLNPQKALPQGEFKNMNAFKISVDYPILNYLKMGWRFGFNIYKTRNSVWSLFGVNEIPEKYNDINENDLSKLLDKTTSQIDLDWIIKPHYDLVTSIGTFDFSFDFSLGLSATIGPPTVFIKLQDKKGEPPFISSPGLHLGLGVGVNYYFLKRFGLSLGAGINHWSFWSNFGKKNTNSLEWEKTYYFYNFNLQTYHIQGALEFVI